MSGRWKIFFIIVLLAAVFLAFWGLASERYSSDSLPANTEQVDPVVYADGEGNSVAVTFSDESAFVVTPDGTELVLFQHPTGSGFQYSDDTYEIRGQGEEIIFYMGGEELFKGSSSSDEIGETTCQPDQRGPMPCTREYVPVCGSNGQTYGNGCSACADEAVESYVRGECN